MRARLRLDLAWNLVAFCMLCVLVGASAVAGMRWHTDVQRQQETAFQTTASAVASSVSTSVRREIDLVKVEQTLLSLNPGMTNAQFAQWFDTLQAAKRYPGGVGFGYVLAVPASQLAAFGAQYMADPVPNLGVQGAYTVYPAGQRASYCLLRLANYRGNTGLPPTFDYCAPQIPIFGTSPTAAVMASARDTGVLTVAPPIALIPGVLYAFMPIYKGAATPSTVAQRRADLTGWAVSTFDAATILQDAEGDHHDLRVQVYSAIGGTRVLLASVGTAPRGKLTTSLTPVSVDGSWSVVVSGSAAAGGMSASAQGWVVFGVGVGISLLLFGVVQVLVRSRSRALRLVREQTVELRHQALHDPLTGLPNRALILDRFEQLLARVRRHETPAAVMFIDLDHFKEVNDTFGHGAGDTLLREVAVRLSRELRDSDTVGRLGGDEFVVLVEGESLADGPSAVAERLLDVLQQPLAIDNDVTLAVQASIGVAFASGDSPDDVLRHADVALYEAKAAGKGRFALYRSAHASPDGTPGSPVSALRAALAAGEFSLRYQPIFDLEAMSVCGVEALVRWDHPERGTLLPADFLPSAETSGDIIAIGRFVLDTACRQAALWQQRGYPVLVSVNLSPRQFEDPGLAGLVQRALAGAGLDARWLSLEIAETTLMRDPAGARERLALLRDLGVRLAIDDFGSGCAALLELSTFPVDAVKIDRPFIAGAADSRQAAEVIGMLVRLGKALDICTFAEGIEDGEQLAQLRTEDCDSGQGYLFAKPLDVDKVEPYLREGLVREAGRAPAPPVLAPAPHASGSPSGTLS